MQYSHSMTRTSTALLFWACSLSAATAADSAAFELAVPDSGNTLSIHKAAAKTEDSYVGFRTEVIQNPAGQSQSYQKIATGYENFMSMLLEYTMAFSSDIVWGPEQQVYVRDFISKYKTDSYVEGTAEGNTVTFQLPQTVYWNETMQDGLNLMAIETQIAGGEIIWTYAEDQTMTMVKGDDGSLTLVNGQEGRMYAYVDIASEEWSGYADWAQTYTVNDGTPVTAPEDAEWVKWGCAGLNKTVPFLSTVDVAFAGGKVWIKGLCEAMPEATVEGIVGNGVITIPQGEYLGDYYGRFPMYTLLGTIVEGEDGPKLQLLPFDLNYVLNYDPEAKTMTAADPDVVFIFNNGTAQEYNLDFWQNLSLSLADDMAGTPSNPYDLVANEIPNDCLVFKFSIDPLSTTGAMLDPASLAYRIYIDGDLWVFYKEEFPRGLPGGADECTEIPVTFSNGADIYKWNSTCFEVDLSVLDSETVGVQSVYNWDGITTVSDIMTYNMATGEVTAIPDSETGVGATSAFMPEATTSYDLLGRRVAAGAKGLLIETTTLPDGSLRTVKRAVR